MSFFLPTTDATRLISLACATHVPPIDGLIAIWDRKGHLHAVDAAAVEEIDLSPPKKFNGRRRRK